MKSLNVIIIMISCIPCERTTIFSARPSKSSPVLKYSNTSDNSTKSNNFKRKVKFMRDSLQELVKSELHFNENLKDDSTDYQFVKLESNCDDKTCEEEIEDIIRDPSYMKPRRKKNSYNLNELMINNIDELIQSPLKIGRASCRERVYVLV